MGEKGENRGNLRRVVGPAFVGGGEVAECAPYFKFRGKCLIITGIVCVLQLP